MDDATRVQFFMELGKYGKKHDTSKEG